MNNPNYKNGIKDLTDVQMRTSLPAYEIMMEKIERIRNESFVPDMNPLSGKEFETMKYDQIFSLLGGRGAGKTSMLLTIYNKFRKEDVNITLPIIMPELLDENEDILSWLLSAMKSNLDEIEESIKETGYQKQNDNYRKMLDKYNFFERCVFNKENELREQYKALKDMYFTKDYQYRGDNYIETRDWKAKSVDNSFQLMKGFVKYWDALVEVYFKYLNRDTEKKENVRKPLIFIFIDDADLKPQIFNELIFVIPKYLSHPNVIVFVSASPKTLSYSVKNYMYSSITRRPLDLVQLMNLEYSYNSAGYTNPKEEIIRFKELRYGREYDKIVKLSEEILRKLFPVYDRLYLKKYDKYEDKGLLQMFEDDSSECEKTIPFSDKVAVLLSEFYDNIIDLHENGIHIIINNESIPQKETIEEKKKSFKLIKFKSNKKPYIDNIFYLAFIDKYPRDITGVYFALKEMLGDLYCKLKELYNSNGGNDIESIPSYFLDVVYEILVKFLNAVIMSNSKLNMFIRKTDKLLKKQLLHWQMYINYAEVLDVFRDPNYIQQNKKDPDSFAEMMCLLNFMEQIIVLVMPQRRTTHGHSEFCDLLNLMECEVIKQSKDLDFMFRQYLTFHSLGIVPEFHIERIEDCNHFIYGITNLKLLDRINIENIDEDKNQIILKEIQMNRKWYETYAQVFIKKYSLFRLIPEYKNVLFIFKSQMLIDDLYDKFYTEYYHCLKNILIGEESVSIGSSNIWDIEKLRIQLNSCLNKLHLCVLTDEIFLAELNDALDDLDHAEDKHLTSEVSSFIDFVFRSKRLERNSVISRLKIITEIIRNHSSDYAFLQKWYKNFEYILQTYIKVDVNCDEYKEYNNVMKDIRDIYKNYICFYVEEIRNRAAQNEDEATVKLKNNVYNNLKHLIDIARDQEWNSLMEAVEKIE